VASRTNLSRSMLFHQLGESCQVQMRSFPIAKRGEKTTTKRPRAQLGPFLSCSPACNALLYTHVSSEQHGSQREPRVVIFPWPHQTAGLTRISSKPESRPSRAGRKTRFWSWRMDWSPPGPLLKPMSSRPCEFRFLALISSEQHAVSSSPPPTPPCSFAAHFLRMSKKKSALNDCDHAGRRHVVFGRACAHHIQETLTPGRRRPAQLLGLTGSGTHLVDLVAAILLGNAELLRFFPSHQPARLMSVASSGARHKWIIAHCIPCIPREVNALSILQ
jgi:hypothetical protein